MSKTLLYISKFYFLILALVLPFVASAHDRVQITSSDVTLIIAMFIAGIALCIAFFIFGIGYALDAHTYSEEKLYRRKNVLAVIILLVTIPSFFALFSGDYLIFNSILIVVPILLYLLGPRKNKSNFLIGFLFVFYISNIGAFLLGVYDNPQEWGLAKNPHTTYYLFDPTKPEIIAHYSWTGKKHGSYKRLDLKGQVIEEGSYKNNLKDGPWIEPKQKGSYINGKKHGPWIIYAYKNVIEEEGSYKNGLKDGPWVVYDYKGLIEEEGSYKNGQKDGPWKMYSMGEEYGGSYKNGKKEGHWIEHDQSEGPYIEGLKHGLWIEFSSNGTRLEKKYLRDKPLSYH